MFNPATPPFWRQGHSVEDEAAMLREVKLPKVTELVGDKDEMTETDTLLVKRSLF